MAAADGAAFDPVGRVWRTTATSPVPITAHAASTVIGDTVYILTNDQLVSYDASDDAWTTHPAAPTAPGYSRLAAGDGRIIVIRGDRYRADPADQIYDPATQTWSALPADPIGQTFDRYLTSTPAGLVLTGYEPTGPSHAVAAVLDPHTSRWTRLPDSVQREGWRWTWTGKRMLAASIPYGGVLDPATGEWGSLPHLPRPDTGGWPVVAFAGPRAAIDGWMYDDRAQTWTKLPTPDGAPPLPGSAVWAHRHLIVLGGVDHDKGAVIEALSTGAWSYTVSP